MKATARRCLALVLAAAIPALAAIPGRVAAPASKRARVVLVGWDGADWKLLDPLLKEGRLPNLAALVANGRTWNLDTYQPMASPLIWTTIATGRSPLDHGVTGGVTRVNAKVGAWRQRQRSPFGSRPDLCGGKDRDLVPRAQAPCVLEAASRVASTRSIWARGRARRRVSRRASLALLSS